MSRFRCKGQVSFSSSAVLYYYYYCYIVQLNMTIYRQNSYKLLTIHKNEIKKTKNTSKNDQNGSKRTLGQERGVPVGGVPGYLES